MLVENIKSKRIPCNASDAYPELSCDHCGDSGPHGRLASYVDPLTGYCFGIYCDDQCYVDMLNSHADDE